MKRSVLVLIALSSACATAGMEVPGALASVEPVPVEGRQALRLRERVSFGEYETAEVDRSWTKGSGLRIGPAARERRRQEYTFVLNRGGAPAWRGSCEAAASMGGLLVGGGQLELQSGSSLDCDLTPADSGAAWSLRLGEDRRDPLRGVFTNGPDAWRVTGTNWAVGGAHLEEMTGFEIRQGDRVLGAVEVVNSGRIWMAPELSAAERERFAAAAMALLLWRDVREDELDGQ